MEWRGRAFGTTMTPDELVEWSRKLHAGELFAPPPTGPRYPLYRMIVTFLHGVGRPVKAESVADHLGEREEYIRSALIDLHHGRYVAKSLCEDAGWGWNTTGRWNHSLMPDGRPDASEEGR